MPLKRPYPQVNQIPDRATQQSVRLLWDRVFDALDTLESQQAAFDQAETANTERAARLTALELKVEIGSPSSGALTSNQGIPGGGGSGGGTGGGGDPDNPGGGGDTDTSWDNPPAITGFNASGPTGHVPPGSALTTYTVGLIVGGVAKEWNSLLGAAGSGAIRNANMNEWLERVIWHLNLAGFTAGRNQNPSGATGIDSVVAMINGFARGYDLLPYTAFFPDADIAVPVTPFMLPLLPLETTLIPSGGIAD